MYRNIKQQLFFICILNRFLDLNINLYKQCFFRLTLIKKAVQGIKLEEYTESDVQTSAQTQARL